MRNMTVRAGGVAEMRMRNNVQLFSAYNKN